MCQGNPREILDSCYAAKVYGPFKNVGAQQIEQPSHAAELTTKPNESGNCESLEMKGSQNAQN